MVRAPHPGALCRRNSIMPRAKISPRQPSASAPAINDDSDGDSVSKRGHAGPRKEPVGGPRERKKARLRQQIIETALHLFRQRGYEKTRIDDIVQTLEISQPTFFRYFPSKEAVLREVGRRAFARQAESLKSELSTKAPTEQRLRRFYETLGNTTEVGRPLWQAVILAGAMDPVRSPELRGAEAATVSLLREFIEGLFNTVVRQWAVDLTGPHKLTERARNAVEFFLRGAKP